MDKKTIFIMFDCPLETCDKLWLYDSITREVQGNAVVKIIPFPYKKSYADMLLFGKHKLLNRSGVMLGIIYQCLYAAVKKKKKDTIIIWGFMQGIVGNLILPSHGDERVISLNWLMPPKRDSLWWKPIKKAVASQAFVAVTNNREAKEEWIKEGGKLFEKMQVINDVYNDRIEFSDRNESGEKKYCFTGGMNNRDWRVVFALAEKFPAILFKCVAPKKDWEDQITCILPKNIQVFFGLPAKEYYDMLENSYLVLLPLKENKTSGLINIIRAMQKGILVITTRFPFTELYFYDKNCSFLVDGEEEYEKAFLKLWTMNTKEYQEEAGKNAAFLRENFSPEKVGKMIYNLTGGN